MITRELRRTAVVGHRPNQAKPYCSKTRATVSKADAPANAKSAARPLTKGSGSGRSSSGAASIAAPAPITAAGHGSTDDQRERRNYTGAEQGYAAQPRAERCGAVLGRKVAARSQNGEGDGQHQRDEQCKRKDGV